MCKNSTKYPKKNLKILFNLVTKWTAWVFDLFKNDFFLENSLKDKFLNDFKLALVGLNYSRKTCSDQLYYCQGKKYSCVKVQQNIQKKI